LNTLILAFVVFLCVRTINNLRKTQAAEEAAAPPLEPPRQEILLAEIRDLLAKNAIPA